MRQRWRWRVALEDFESQHEDYSKSSCAWDAVNRWQELPMNAGITAAFGYRFESFELLAATREVFDRRRDERLSLQPKMFEVLLYLIEHRSRVVLKEELVREIWEGLVVSEGAVPQCVSMLRKALGDTGRSQQILKTYYGRGYR